MSPLRILVVDDEDKIRQVISIYLKNEGYMVGEAMDGEEALKKYRSEPWDLIVLDVMMPKMDGISVCREIRKTSQIPIIMLTAKNEEVDRILGLEFGADDYMGKPFSPRELVARIRSILRRTRRQYQGSTLTVGKGRVCIHLNEQVVMVEGRQATLTPTELALLIHFARHPGQVFSRMALLETVWGYDFPGDLRTVDVHVRRLRRKIEADPANPTIILTRFGVGYVLAQG